MIIYSISSFNQRFGNIEFLFKSPPTKDDVKKAFKSWCQGEKMTFALEDLKESILSAKYEEISVIDN